MKRRNPQLIDREATAAAGFLDPRSYIKRGRDGVDRTFLFGEDMTALRRKVFERCRNHCEMPVNGYSTGIRCNRNIDWATSEMHHSPSLFQGGDDSLEGVLMICRRCHVAAHHRTTRWRKNGKA